MIRNLSGSWDIYTSGAANFYPSGSLLNSSYYLTNASTFSGANTFLAPNGSNEIGHAGNGYARISYIGPSNLIKKNIIKKHKKLLLNF